MQLPPPRTEIRSLTGLRGLAAVWVMVGHYFGELPGLGLFHTIAAHMYLAVDFFMVLSGFVLALTYERRFSPGIKFIEYIRFVQHRVARLFPLYLVVTSFCLIMMRLGVGDNSSTQTLPAIVLNYLMAQSWWWPDDSISGTGWSLSIEWGLNLLFPLFVVLLLHTRLRWALMFSIVAGAVLVVQAIFDGQLSSDQALRGAIDWYYVPQSLVRCASEFGLGMICWRVRPRLPVLASSRVQGLIIAAMCAAVLSPQLDVAFVALACLLVIGCSFETSGVAARLGGRVPHWLGAISFSIYLLHLPVLPLRSLLAGWITGEKIVDFYVVGSPLQGMVCMAIVLLLSTLSFYRFERPAQRWLKRPISVIASAARQPIPPV
jgi:peptidoglycan/LPS O-acetylase OafA/YrhL